MARQKKNPPPPPRPHCNLSEIDDDDTAFDATDDSVLEMAKRLDAASIISDPSFIEGPSRNAYRMDQIASDSEEEDDRDYCDDDCDSMDYGHDDVEDGRRRGSEQSRGEDSESYSDDGDHEDDGRYGYQRNGSKGSSSGRHSHHHQHYLRLQRNQNRQLQQQQQQHYNKYNTTSYHHQGVSNKLSRGSTRGGDHAHNIINNSTSNKQYQQQQKRSYTASAAAKNSSSHEKQSSTLSSSQQQKDTQRQRDRPQGEAEKGGGGNGDESPKQRRKKMIMIPVAVILIVAIVVIVAVLVGKNGTSSSLNNNDKTKPAFEPIPVPTISPTYIGLYYCPYGKSGPTPTKGCLGYVQCTALGTIMGDIQYCSSGTLYDVRSGVCDFAENVYCSTKVPTQEDVMQQEEASSPTTMTTIVSSPISSQVDGSTPSSPTTMNSPSITQQEVSSPTTSEGGDMAPSSPTIHSPPITVGPVTTSNHKILFENLSNPGQLNSNAMASILQHVQDYVNIFYSSGATGAYSDVDYVLENISNVTIELVPTKFTFVQNSNRRRNNQLRRHRHLQQPVAIVANGLAVDYQQTTKYNTIDSSITVGTIVRHPYLEQYQERIVGYLKSVDATIYSTLTRVLFVEG